MAMRRFTARVSFVERGRQQLGIAVDALRQLGEVVRADREAVEELGELGRQDHVVRNFRT
jgi:hypothetical protein